MSLRIVLYSALHFAFHLVWIKLQILVLGSFAGIHELFGKLGLSFRSLSLWGKLMISGGNHMIVFTPNQAQHYGSSEFCFKVLNAFKPETQSKTKRCKACRICPFYRSATRGTDTKTLGHGH